MRKLPISFTSKKRALQTLSVFVRQSLLLTTITLSMVASLTVIGCQPSKPIGPCDIYAQGGTPCVAAHSTTRLLNSKYKGPLYQIMRESDGATLDIGIIDGGYANAAAQDDFSKGTLSYITIIYDQSGTGNHLYQAAPGTFKGPAKGEFNTLPIADMAPVMLDGHKVYGVYVMPGMGFRNNNASELAINDEPEGIYYVVDGTHYSSGCCFDYGNSSTNGKAVGTGTMETTYYGTATAWGRGNGEGPWIMADMEAGLFSGWDAKQNDVPSIDWRFVSVFVNGGGGNQWDLRGADATQNNVTTFYSGIRPGTPESSSYYPMNKKGAILLGNGGDNGNGSAGTFYEGVMTTGYPTDQTINAVQANIATANYSEMPLRMSRLTSFTTEKPQPLTVTFTNNTDSPIDGIELSLQLPQGWVSKQISTTGTDAPLAPGAFAASVYQISPTRANLAGFLYAQVNWNGGEESMSQRIRCTEPVRINEVGFYGEQFIELFNNSSSAIDLGGYTVEITRSGWAPVTAAKFPKGITIGPNDFLVLRASAESLMADSLLLTTIFSPISTGPRISVPAGSTTLPLTAVNGMKAGQRIGINVGAGVSDKYEEVLITEVGTPATQSVLSTAAKAGDTTLEIETTINLRAGDALTISTGQRKEIAIIKSITKVSDVPAPRRWGQPNQPHIPGQVELEAPLANDHMEGVDVSAMGSGITITPALQYEHISGEAVQVLPENVTGATINAKAPFYTLAQDGVHYGYTPSLRAGAIALYKDNVLIDAIVYGSKQSNSSGNGTITRPDLATLEGEQTFGGNIAVVPNAFRMGAGFRPMPGQMPQPQDIHNSLVRFPDGADTDNLFEDFTTSDQPTPGAANKNE